MRLYLFLFLLLIGCSTTNFKFLGEPIFNLIEGEDFSSGNGVKIENKHVGFFDEGDWFGYDNVNFNEGAKSLILKVASANSEGKIEIRIDSINGPILAIHSMYSTGGWFDFVEKSISINCVSGVHDLYFKGVAGNGIFNLDWFILSSDKVVIIDPLYVDRAKGEWSLVTIPDTQHYSQNLKKAPFDHMSRAFDWIVSMREQLNIKLVQGLGDITENWNRTSEWDRSFSAWNKLEGKMPYMPILGNHDDPYQINQYFPAHRFSDKSWWGSDFGGIENNYFLMTIGKEDYLFLHIEPYDQYSDYRIPGIEWAKEVLGAFPAKKVVLATHDIWDTQYIKNLLLTQFDNIVLSNAGHSCVREKSYITHGPNFGISHNFITDYQCDDWEVMRLRYYVFKPREDKVYFYTYSPITNSFDTDSESQGTFKLIQDD